ncbi:MAG: DNA (cytosine-5-)-methyltransferase [bacterium]
MLGVELRAQRLKQGISQSKLSDITGIQQAKLSAFERHKQSLSRYELNTIIKALNSLDDSKIKALKKKRYKDHVRDGSVISSRPRRHYQKTLRNQEYLTLLNKLETDFFSQPKKKLNAISFFAGCGGLCYGVKAAGFNLVATNELVEAYKAIYRLNFKSANFLPNDITTISNADIDKIKKAQGHIDLMIGGPPCQGFSLAGKRDVNDQRNNLFQNYLNIADQIKPKVILMENVRLLTSMKDPNGKLVSERILDTFQSIGYASNFFQLNAKDYAVPQHRERVIFIGVRSDLQKQPSIPEPLCNQAQDIFSKTLPFYTFGDAISDLEYLESGEASKHDSHHKAITHPEHVIRWLIDVPEGKSAHDNEDKNLRPPSGYNTTYKRQVWNEPGGTVATTYAMISGCRNVHPVATRSLTTREALRLQSFPDSFKLCGKLGDIRTTIGNAVPPLLAYRLGQFIRDTYIL